MLRSKLGLTRSNQVTEMLRPSVAPWVVATFLIIAVAGCKKNSGEAVVLAKEHVDAALPTAETPGAQSEPSPDEHLRPMADDEIAVDGHAMRPEVRGTSRDLRAVQYEQWIVKVRMLDNGSHIPSPGRSSKMEEIARGRSGQSQVSHGQVYRNRLGRRD
jgi:hypothetical protein